LVVRPDLEAVLHEVAQGGAAAAQEGQAEQNEPRSGTHILLPASQPPACVSGRSPGVPEVRNAQILPAVSTKLRGWLEIIWPTGDNGAADYLTACQAGQSTQGANAAFRFFCHAARAIIVLARTLPFLRTSRPLLPAGQQTGCPRISFQQDQAALARF